MTQREFLVHISLEVPSSVSAEQIAELRVREGEAARRLADEGHLARLWRVPGEWANWGLWRATDAAELQAILDTLPLRPYMTIDVRPTLPHPSDPLTRTLHDEPLTSRLRRNTAGLVPVVVQQQESREVLTLAWTDDIALARTITTGVATYWSRSRQEYWVEGETSGHVHRVKEIRLDCDGESLLYVVEQSAPACRTGTHSCFDAEVVHRSTT